VITSVENKISLNFVMLVDESTSDFEITMDDDEDEKPPAYSQGSKYPVHSNCMS